MQLIIAAAAKTSSKVMQASHYQISAKPIEFWEVTASSDISDKRILAYFIFVAYIENSLLAKLEKKWNGSVGFDAVKEVYTAKAIYKADYAFVITNSYFSQAAKKASKNIGVISIRQSDLEDCLKNLLLYENSR